MDRKYLKATGRMVKGNTGDKYSTLVLVSKEIGLTGEEARTQSMAKGK